MLRQKQRKFDLTFETIYRSYHSYNAYQCNVESNDPNAWIVLLDHESSQRGQD